MKNKTVATGKSKITPNGKDLKMMYPKAVREAIGLRAKDVLEHSVIVIGKETIIVSQIVTNDLRQKHEELLQLLKG